MHHKEITRNKGEKERKKRSKEINIRKAAIRVIQTDFFKSNNEY